MLEISTDTLMFIILGGIVALLIAYNVSLLRVKRRLSLLEGAVIATLQIINDTCQSISDAAKDEANSHEQEFKTKQRIDG